jgi:hypothetical protein
MNAQLGTLTRTHFRNIKPSIDLVLFLSAIRPEEILSDNMHVATKLGL